MSLTVSVIIKNDNNIDKFIELFEPFGNIKSYTKKRNEDVITIIFDDERDAEDAKKAMDGTNFLGQDVKVEWTKNTIKQKSLKKSERDQLYDFIVKNWVKEDQLRKVCNDDEDTDDIDEDLEYNKFCKKQRNFCNIISDEIINHLMFIKGLIEKHKVELIDKEDPNDGWESSGFYIINSKGGFHIYHER